MFVTSQPYSSLLACRQPCTPFFLNPCVALFLVLVSAATTHFAWLPVHGCLSAQEQLQNRALKHECCFRVVCRLLRPIYRSRHLLWISFVSPQLFFGVSACSEFLLFLNHLFVAHSSTAILRIAYLWCLRYFACCLAAGNFISPFLSLPPTRFGMLRLTRLL